MRRIDWADRLAEEIGDLLADERTTGEILVERMAQELRKAYLAGLEDTCVEPNIEDTKGGYVHLYQPTVPTEVMVGMVPGAEISGAFVQENLSRLTWVGRKPEPEPVTTPDLKMEKP